MPAALKDRLQATALSLAILAAFLLAWQGFVSATSGPAADMDPELAALLGPQAKGESALPSPGDVGAEIWGISLTPSMMRAPTTRASASSWPIRWPAC